VFSFLLLVQRLCAPEDALNQGLCPVLPGVYVASAYASWRQQDRFWTISGPCASGRQWTV